MISIFTTYNNMYKVFPRNRVLSVVLVIRVGLTPTQFFTKQILKKNLNSQSLNEMKK